MIPGEIITNNHTITLNANKTISQIKVANLGDRPIQVGSHFHFFEVNKLLSFNRKIAFAKRLNIPSGTATRFEPGEEKTIELIEFGGSKTVIGFNDLVNDQANAKSLNHALTQLTTNSFINNGDNDEL